MIDLEREAHPVFERAAVLVGAAVGERRDEGRQQVAVGAVQFEEVEPGARGGANWPPSSYDPATNILYVCATDAANLFRGGEDDQQITPEGQRYLGSAFGGAPLPAAGIFAALDMKTNKLVWQQRWRDSCYSGSVTTAGGLVFTGRNDGRLTALNSSTGKRLWEFQTGAGMNSPVSVFEYEGDEYVVAYSAGSLFAGTVKGDSVWLFSTKGTLSEGDSPSTR